MADPSAALHKGIVTALRASAPLAALIGDGASPPANPRIYNRVPEAPTFPYVTIGEDQIVDDGNGCGDAWEAIATVHGWSREPGMAEVKALAGAVRGALAAEIAATGFRVVEGQHLDTQYLRDPDGLTSHAVCRFRYLIDPA